MPPLSPESQAPPGPQAQEQPAHLSSGSLCQVGTLDSESPWRPALRGVLVPANSPATWAPPPLLVTISFLPHAPTLWAISPASLSADPIDLLQRRLSSCLPSHWVGPWCHLVYPVTCLPDSARDLLHQAHHASSMGRVIPGTQNTCRLIRVHTFLGLSGSSVKGYGACS